MTEIRSPCVSPDENCKIYTEIAERREQPDPNRVDILSLLMSAQDEEGNPMTDQELRDELMTMLLAFLPFAP
jgi:cytochrome P450